MLAAKYKTLLVGYHGRAMERHRPTLGTGASNTCFQMISPVTTISGTEVIVEAMPFNAPQ
jgi:hypothetical protein